MSGISKEIKRRLRSIKNTRQITRAMEMVSAVKMRKSVKAVLASRDYSHTAWHVLNSILKTNTTLVNQFVTERVEGAICCVVISGNRGLAGSFNRNIAEAVENYISVVQRPSQNDNIVIVTLGTKARDELIARGLSVSADFLKVDMIHSSGEIEALISMIIQDYHKKSMKKVMLFYTDFESALKQTVRTRVLLPLSLAEDPHLGITHNNHHDELGDEDEFEFEQDKAQMLNIVIPRILETQVFQAVLESQASEHSARMLAMRNASEAASDMISDLSLEYNKQRQGAITQELAEISASRMALAE